MSRGRLAQAPGQSTSGPERRGRQERQGLLLDEGALDHVVALLALAGADLEAARRGSAAVDLKQETTINLYGVSDPAAAGRAVSDGQRQVNDEIVRNMQGAIS